MKRKRCRIRDHLWRRVKTRDGSHVEKCERCGDRFPCAHSGCGHVDCHAVRGETLPDGVLADASCTCPTEEIMLDHRPECPAGAS